MLKKIYQLLVNTKATLYYFTFIILINVTYLYFPFMTIAGAPFSSGDMVIGVIYILRDFAQREIKHYVIVAMLLGAGFSYLLSNKTMAIASVCSFMVGEFIDWIIFTFTGKPLSQRLLWSAAISAPIDSIVFLGIYGPFNLAGLTVISFSKILGVLTVWYYWHRRHNPNNANRLLYSQ